MVCFEALIYLDIMKKGNLRGFPFLVFYNIELTADALCVTATPFLCLLFCHRLIPRTVRKVCSRDIKIYLSGEKKKGKHEAFP